MVLKLFLGRLVKTQVGPWTPLKSRGGGLICISNRASDDADSAYLWSTIGIDRHIDMFYKLSFYDLLRIKGGF